MKKTDELVRILATDIENKDILEVACGAAGFSVSAARIAHRVDCIDLDDSRLNEQAKQSNIHFQIMDASEMSFPDNAFDTIFIYNAFSHIHSQWDMIERECKRVLKTAGKIYIVGTWKLDTNLMTGIFGDHAVQYGGFFVVKMMK